MIFKLNWYLSLFHFCFELLFLPSNLHLHSHDLNLLEHIFGTHTLLDKSLRVLQLSIHLSNLAANG